MKIYFLSSSPCALKVNGTPVGCTDGFPRALSLHLSDAPIIEFTPFNSGMGATFRLDEAFFTSPPEYVHLFFCDLFLCLYFAVAPSPLPALKKISCSANAFVFSLGEAEVFLFNRRTEKLGNAFDPCEVKERDSLILIEGRKVLFVADRDRTIYNGKASRYDLSEDGRTLTVVRPLCDFCRRKETLRFDLTPSNLTSSDLPLSAPSPVRTRSPRPNAAEEFLLAVLLQDLLLGEDVADLLTPDLAADIETLKKYLGPYTAVHPSEKGAAFVVCPSENQVHRLKLFSAESADGKISGLKRIF